MNTSEFKFFRRVAKLCPGATLTMLSLMLVFEGSTVTSEAQTSVFVPGNASGCFGSPNDTCVPLVAALTVNGPGTITVTYVSGTVDLGPFSVGPTGGRANVGVGSQYPLQEANAVSGGTLDNIGALIGVFVPTHRVNDHRGFQAVDGTKSVSRVGIKPNLLRFVGESFTFNVRQAGTLYLGINDTLVDDNSGGFTVTVSQP
jgi:hypothetical protein